MTLQRIIGRVAVMGLIGTASASICSAREYATPYDNHPTLTVTAGQGGYIRLPDLTPMPSSYALTGEMQENRQSLRRLATHRRPDFPNRQRANRIAANTLMQAIL